MRSRLVGLDSNSLEYFVVDVFERFGLAIELLGLFIPYPHSPDTLLSFKGKRWQDTAHLFLRVGAGEFPPRLGWGLVLSNAFYFVTGTALALISVEKV